MTTPNQLEPRAAACPAWCTQTPDSHPTEDGWTYHAVTLPVSQGVTVELSQLAHAGGPEVFVNHRRDEDLSIPEAHMLAAVILKAVAMADGGESIVAEVPAAMLEQLREPVTLEGHELDKLADAIVEGAMPLARRVWAIVEDELRQRQEVER